MSGQFTEVSSTGWFSRIAGAIKGIVVGLVLFVLAFPLLFWNEGRAVAREQALNEGAAAVISVDAASPDSRNSGRLVHVSGQTATDDVLTDDEFGVSISGLRLLREVEMYQWVEEQESRTEKQVGGGEKTVTTYSYKPKWSSSLVDSGAFKVPEGHVNPAAMPFSSREYQARNVSLGGFTLNDGQIARAGEKLEIPSDTDITVPVQYADAAHRTGGTVLLGQDPANPAIGDMRVRFYYVPPAAVVSIVSEQTGTSFTRFRTPSGGDIDLLENGTVSAERMFEIAQRENAVLTWILRGVGFFLMFVGFSMFLRPLSVIADVVPLFGSIVGAGTGLIAFLVAFAGSFLTIAVGWVFYRPLVGIPLLIVGIGALAFAFTKIRGAPAPVRTAATA
jgi:hypothetical protein